MTRIDAKFAALKAEGRKAFVSYIMAGDPDYATSMEVVRGLPGAGVDIIELDRIRRVLERHGERFLTRIYTAEEIARYRDRLPELAARFAAKEAFSKALGLGMRKGLKWRDIEVFHDRNGKPGLRLHGRSSDICRKAGITGIHLSLSDENDYGVAVVVLEKGNGGWS